MISGNFSISRDDMKALIEAHGGKNSGSVSGKTSYLLVGTKPGPEKVKKATDLGIEIIDEATLRQMIGSQSETGDGLPGASALLFAEGMPLPGSDATDSMLPPAGELFEPTLF